MTKIEDLKAALAAATTELPTTKPEERLAKNGDVADLIVPFTMYETTYTYINDTLVRGEVRPITVTRYGINHAAGATAPSISFTGADRRKAIGSVRDFYLTAEDAQAEVDYHLAYATRERAKEKLSALMHNALPALIECAEALEFFTSIYFEPHHRELARTALAKLENNK